ncbi:MAG: TetR/AcrR family transcriptional regulator [Chlorobi bacterium]|nr:TetR/AcrR family transcriptional regulator [Chlorobiota bacterium]
MSPRTKEQFDEIRSERKARIMQAALEVFSEEGFGKASISKIAGRAGVSKGLMYNYFKSKEELIETIFIDAMTRLMSGFEVNPKTTPSKEEFTLFIKKSMDDFKNNLPYWRMYFSVMMQADVMHKVEKELFEFAMPVIMMMAKYYESQGFENPLAKARLLAATLDGIGLNYMMDTENFPYEEAIDMIIEKLI